MLSICSSASLVLRGTEPVISGLVKGYLPSANQGKLCLSDLLASDLVVKYQDILTGWLIVDFTSNQK